MLAGLLSECGCSGNVESENLMRRIVIPVVSITVTLAATYAQAQNVRWPQFFNPPPPRAQVADAQIWDPYPLPDVGGPADSTRPRDFFYPPPEATRGRYPNPGTFPRSAPWLRSQAPVDYPNIRKKLSSRRAQPANEMPGEFGSAVDAPPEKMPQEENAPVEAVPTPPTTSKAATPGKAVAPARPSRASSEF
jgi:hypothetical protein